MGFSFLFSVLFSSAFAALWQFISTAEPYHERSQDGAFYLVMVTVAGEASPASALDGAIPYDHEYEIRDRVKWNPSEGSVRLTAQREDVQLQDGDRLVATRWTVESPHFQIVRNQLAVRHEPEFVQLPELGIERLLFSDQPQPAIDIPDYPGGGSVSLRVGQNVSFGMSKLLTFPLRGDGNESLNDWTSEYHLVVRVEFSAHLPLDRFGYDR